MTPLVIFFLVLLAAIATLASYISRVYAEFGKILTREIEENLDAWEELVEPHLGLERDHAALSAAVVQQLALGLMALGFGALLFGHASSMEQPTAADIGQAILGLVLVIMLCLQILPSVLFDRTRGEWAAQILWPIRLLLWVVTPITVFIRFFFSVASLAEEPTTAEEENAVDVEALIEAGEEEGILEKSDRELVRSAVEFGDKLVREIMTPRPEVFAVPESITLEHFLELLKEHNYSRVPVYQGTLDNVTGIAFAHDLLQITDVEARTRTVESIAHPACFVPETKKGYELLREMQRDKHHMCLVIDEYGGVAGLVTIENLLEEIVGEIRDEHEKDTAGEEPVQEENGAWVVPGSYPADQLGTLLGEPVELDEEYESATVGGLVSEIEGRIPHAGEVLVLESIGLRLEVVASTARKVEQVRVFPPSVTGGEAREE